MEKDEQIISYLDRLGSTDSSPGGGSASALVGAIAVALLEKVSALNNIRAEKKGGLTPLDEARVRQLKQLRNEIFHLVKKDSEVFNESMKLFAEGRHSDNYQKALKECATVPLEICKKIIEAYEKIEAEQGRTSNWLISDLLESQYFLATAFDAARLNIDINLKNIDDDHFKTDLQKQFTTYVNELQNLHSRLVSSSDHRKEAAGGAAKVLSGTEVAQKERSAISSRIQALKSKNKTLCLVGVQVGNSKDVQLYSKSIEKSFTALGIHYNYVSFPENISEQELCSKIEGLNTDNQVTGIMIFSPLPKQLNYVTILNALKLSKDVEGRRILHGYGDRVISPTASAVIRLLEETGVEVAGKEAVVVGHSDVVGKPIALLLLDKLATVTVCHIKTRSLEEHVKKADIVVTAAGKPGLIKGAWIKPGAVVIDVGENVLDGKIVGDVEFDAAAKNAAFITPVPGGVGPVTNVMLVKNLLTLHQIQENNGNSHTR